MVNTLGCFTQRHVQFVHFLANLSEQKYFFNGLSLDIYYLLLVFPLHSLVCISPHVLEISYSTRYNLWHLEYFFSKFLSLQINMTTLLTRSSDEKQLRLGCQKTLVETERHLKSFGFKFQRICIGSNHYSWICHSFQ